MDADFSIELGGEDPVLDFPWKDPAGKLTYVDLKRHPELLARIEEAEVFPELRDFLRTLNSPRSVLETAKCDAWATTELSAEEDVYEAPHKFASYVDVVFSKVDASKLDVSDVDAAKVDARRSLSVHETFVQKLVALLRRAPETPSSVEACVRRCYFGEGSDVREGFYCTLYVSGYGEEEALARQNWGVALKLVGNAIVQLSKAG